MPDLHFAAHSGELGGYLALPVGEGPHPGVIVIQDALGLSDDIREQADRLAAAGYLALAPYLYSGRGIRCVAHPPGVALGEGPAYEDIDAARPFSGPRGLHRTDRDHRLLHGRWLRAAVRTPAGSTRRRSTTARCRGCDRAARRRVPDRRQLRRARPGPARPRRATRAGARAAGVAHDVKEYPDAGHSFLNRFNVGPLLTPRSGRWTRLPPPLGGGRVAAHPRVLRRAPQLIPPAAASSERTARESRRECGGARRHAPAR